MLFRIETSRGLTEMHLVTSLVYFSRSIERKSFLFVKSFIFINDENGLMISETQQCLVLLISG